MTAQLSADRPGAAHPSICWDAAHEPEWLTAAVEAAPTLRPQAVSSQVKGASADSGSDGRANVADLVRARRHPVQLLASTGIRHYARRQHDLHGWPSRPVQSMCGKPYVGERPLTELLSTQLATCRRCLRSATRHPDEVLSRPVVAAVSAA